MKHDLKELVPSELGSQLGRAERPVNFAVDSPTNRPQTSYGLRVLMVYPNMRGHTMLPPAIALFSALLKQRGFHFLSIRGINDTNAREF